MSKQQIHSFPFHSFPKENMLGTSGINEFIPTSSPIPKFSGTHGNEWEWVGTCESLKPRKGLFFHSFNGDDGSINHQGHLLALNSKGYGRAQLFEWFWGEPSRVIDVTPDYLRNCVFYADCAAMNAAYERWEACHE